MKIGIAAPQTHFTQHEDGQYSVIHRGMPVTRPQSLQFCQSYLRRAFPKLATLPVWLANEGRFSGSDLQCQLSHA